MDLALMCITWKPVIAAAVVLILVQYQCSNLTYEIPFSLYTFTLLSISQNLTKSKKTKCLCGCCFAVMKG